MGKLYRQAADSSATRLGQTTGSWQAMHRHGVSVPDARIACAAVAVPPQPCAPCERQRRWQPAGRAGSLLHCCSRLCPCLCVPLCRPNDGRATPTSM